MKKLAILAVMAAFVGLFLFSTTNMPTPPVQASPGIGVDKVDTIEGGFFDVNEDGSITAADDLTNVLLVGGATNESAPLIVDIIDGKVDVDRSGSVGASDDFNDVDLIDKDVLGGTDGDNDIANGLWPDDVTNLLLVTVGSSVDKVDTIEGGRFDVDESGTITSADDLTNVLLVGGAIDENAPLLVDIIDGKVDVNQSGLVTSADDLTDVDLIDEDLIGTADEVDENKDIADGLYSTTGDTDLLLVVLGSEVDKVDVLTGGLVDVNEDGSITGADDLKDVLMVGGEGTDPAESAPLLVDIIDGNFDVNQSGLITTDDDLGNADLIDKDTLAGTDDDNDIVDGDWPATADNLLLVVLSPVAPPAPLTCQGEPVTISGTTGNDTLDGTSGIDVISGGDGNDTIDGKGGNDIICGGDGADTIFGRDGDDSIKGNAGADNIRGGAGNDIIKGGAGNDILRGGTGDDTVKGNRGADIVKGNRGADTVGGSKGNDIKVAGGLGKDTVNGGIGDDTVKGGDGNDTVRGGPDDDALDGGAGTDVCKGGTGIDTAVNCETETKIP